MLARGRLDFCRLAPARPGSRYAATAAAGGVLRVMSLLPTTIALRLRTTLRLVTTAATAGTVARAIPLDALPVALVVEIQRTGLLDIAEIDRVCAVRIGWDDRRGRIAQQAPRDGREPFVLLHFAGTTLRAEPLVLVLDEQLADQRLAKRRNRYRLGEPNFVAQHVGERRVAR